MVPAIPLDIPASLSLLGVFQALLFAFVLVTRKQGNQIANRCLAALAVTISISVGATILNYAHYFQVYPHLSRISHPFDFLGAPLLFLYIRALIVKTPAGKKALFHFVPAVLCALYLVPFYIQSAEIKRAGLPLANWYYARSALLITQFLIYLIFIVIMLVRYSRAVKPQSAYDKAVRLQIRCVVVSFIVLWIAGISRYAIDLLYPVYIRETAMVLPLGATIIVYVLVYLAIKNSEVMTKSETALPEKKYESSTLTPDRAARYLQKIKHAMEVDKLYTDGNLTLQKLSAKLSIPVQHLSQVVNEQLNQNILDLINRHRVDEVKRRLADPDLKHLSILGIAEDVGFNSKSSFNAVFKKYTDMTPSEFRNSVTRTDA